MWERGINDWYQLVKERKVKCEKIVSMRYNIALLSYNTKIIMCKKSFCDTLLSLSSLFRFITHTCTLLQSDSLLPVASLHKEIAGLGKTAISLTSCRSMDRLKAQFIPLSLREAMWIHPRRTSTLYRKPSETWNWDNWRRSTLPSFKTQHKKTWIRWSISCCPWKRKRISKCSSWSHTTIQTHSAHCRFKTTTWLQRQRGKSQCVLIHWLL